MSYLTFSAELHDYMVLHLECFDVQSYGCVLLPCFPSAGAHSYENEPSYWSMGDACGGAANLYGGAEDVWYDIDRKSVV
jgi:hypothetical protein